MTRVAYPTRDEGRRADSADADPGREPPLPTGVTLLAAVVLAALAAGCLAGSPSSDEGPSGALSVRATAGEVATDWDAEAELVSVAGGEGDLAAVVRNGSLAWLPRFVEGSEGDLGDGRSPRWAFEFQAGDQGLGVVISANGTVVDSLEIDTTPKPALDEGLVDSTEAVQAATDEHPAWRNVPNGTGVAYALYHGSRAERPLWALGLRTEQDERLVVTVDAGTGESLGVAEDGRDPITPRGRAIGPQTPPRVTGTFNGTVDALNQQQSWAIDLQSAGHHELGLHLELHEPVTGTVNGTLTYGGRALVQLGAGPTDPNATASWPRPEAGAYELGLELRQGTEQAYTVYWCATGRDGGDRPTPAC